MKKEYYFSHRDEILKRRKEYYLIHKDKICKYHKEYCLAHKDEIRDYNRKYRHAHRSELIKRRREYYQSNKEYFKDSNRKWEERNIQKVQQYRQQYSRDKREKIRKASLDLLGGKCCQCGITDIRVLEIDHIFNDGKIDRKETKDIQARLEKIIRHPERYQILCANCHSIKTYEFGWGKTNKGIDNEIDEPIQLNFLGEA